MNQINAVFKQAVVTFTCNREVFQQNLELLKNLLNKINARDVNLNPRFMGEQLWNSPGKAPVTYIDIVENNVLTMGVFVLKPGMRLPLHDHPQMYGLIKILNGKVKISSYTVKGDAVQLYVAASKSDQPLLLVAEKHPDVIVDTHSEAIILEPNIGNIHEIESVDGPAAFLDILSPPYETRSKEVGGIRICRYFRIAEHCVGRTCKLEEICPPAWFWNDTYQYQGPEVKSHQGKAQCVT